MNNTLYYLLVILVFLLVIIGFTTLVIKIAKGPKKLYLGKRLDLRQYLGHI